MAGDSLTKQEFCFVRNSLALQEVVTNFKRSGDASGLGREAVMKAHLQEDEEDTEVISHKEAQSGKRCPIKVDGALLEDLQLYAAHLSREAVPTLFSTYEGAKLTPSNMSRVLDTAWQNWGKSEGLQLPKLTAALLRKLAVSTHRQQGPSREEQDALAAHMAHRLETADRYYNKALRKDDRGATVDSDTDHVFLFERF